MNRGWGANVRSVQPGEGWVRRLVGFGLSLRRAWLRRLRPAYVQRMAALRTGECPGCAHDVVDGRDLLWVQNVCGYRWPEAQRIAPFRDRFGLVRLGRPELLLSFALAVLVGGALGVWLPWLAPLAAAPFAFTLWFFRDPERVVPAGDFVVLAPADGLVDDLRHEAGCEFFPGPALRIGIYLSVFDVHVNRAPIAGEVVRCEYRPGRKVPTVRRGFTDANEQLVTWFRGRVPHVVVRQIAGPFARRVCSVLGVGDSVGAGERFGLIKFGSRTEIWLPEDGRLVVGVRVGQRVRGGETVVGRWCG